MAFLTRILFLLVFSCSYISICAQVEPDLTYEKKLDQINQRLQQGQADDNLQLIARSYHDRARLNFDIELANQDVIGDLIESAKLFKYLQDDANFYKVRLMLAGFYIEEEIFLDEAIEITTEAYQFFAQYSLISYEIEALRQIGLAYQNKLDYEKAIIYVDKGLEKSIRAGDKRNELLTRLLMVKLFYELSNVEKVVEQGNLTLAIEKKYGLQLVTTEIQYIIGMALFKDGQIPLATQYLLEAQSNIVKVNELAVDINQKLSEIFFDADSLSRAYAYLKSANDFAKINHQKEQYANANQIAAKYQTRQKDKEIKELEEGYQLIDFKLTQRTRFLIVLSSILALGAFSAFNYYRLQRHRYETAQLIAQQNEEIADQKINELQSVLKIKSLEAMVNGQEAERSRIAAELHDSLGGMLSALKLQYDSLQLDHPNLSDDPDYSRILHLMDDACHDVRDISRNLKPIALEKLGLTAALKDLVNRYSTKGQLDISLDTNDVDGLLDDEAKLHVYRIVQELLTNAVKHAEATEIDIQVNKTDDDLIIMIEDNGKGFEPDQITRGLGLGNLESRINVLRGHLEIDSRLNEGTSSSVTIPLTDRITIDKDSVTIFKM